MKFWFWFLWAIDGVIAAVALYFFFSLAAGGRVGSFNILPWLVILAALAAVVGQRLVALRRAACCCDHYSPAAGAPQSSVRTDLLSHLDSPPQLSLTGAVYR